MFAHTAAKRRFANVAGSVTLHPKKGEPLFVKIKSLIKALKIDIFDAVTSKMRRAHFPNECAFFTFLPFSSFLFLSFLTFFHFSHLLQ